MFAFKIPHSAFRMALALAVLAGAAACATPGAGGSGLSRPTANLSCVWGSSASDVFAVGAR